MKVFEKYWKKYKEEMFIKPQEIILEVFKPFAQRFWKAALRWVLDRIEYHYEDDFKNSYLVMDIKKELNG